MLNKYDRLTNLMDAFQDTKGNTSLIIGAHSGVGFDIALALAKQGRPVIIASHSVEKIVETKAIIQFQSGFEHVFPVHIDYTDFTTVQSFIDTADDLNIPIDLFINAVDYTNNEREITRDGFEKTIAINHFGPYLLVDNLQSQFIDHQTHVVFLNSVAHRHGQIDPIRLASQQHYDPFSTYCNSKLANALVITQLASQLIKRGIAVNGFSSSLAQTHQWAIPFKLVDLVQCYFKRHLIDRKKSQEALMALISTPSAQLDDTPPGRLVIDGKRTQFTQKAYESSLQQQVSDISRKMTYFNHSEWDTTNILSTKTLATKALTKPLLSIKNQTSHPTL